jgi:hypothetical protein
MLGFQRVGRLEVWRVKRLCKIIQISIWVAQAKNLPRFHTGMFVAYSSFHMRSIRLAFCLYPQLAISLCCVEMDEAIDAAAAAAKDNYSKCNRAGFGKYDIMNAIGSMQMFLP